jgi:hypothetical protein
MKRLYQAKKKEIGCCDVTYKVVACNLINRETEVIVIISGEFDAERLSSVYSTEANVERPQT